MTDISGNMWWIKIAAASEHGTALDVSIHADDGEGGSIWIADVGSRLFGPALGKALHIVNLHNENVAAVRKAREAAKRAVAHWDYWAGA